MEKFMLHLAQISKEIYQRKGKNMETSVFWSLRNRTKVSDNSGLKPSRKLQNGKSQYYTSVVFLNVKCFLANFSEESVSKLTGNVFLVLFIEKSFKQLVTYRDWKESVQSHG